jgi:hypothetical protein
VPQEPVSAQRTSIVTQELPLGLSRRRWLTDTGGGFGAVALAALLSSDSRAATSPSVESPFAAKKPHHAPRAKRIISLFMHGGPSHVDLFDPKADLVKYSGKPLPDSFGEVMTRRKVAQNPLLAPIKPFQARGESGLPVSDFLPHMAKCADDLCVIRSCHGDSVNHPQSVYQMNTGSILMGKPSLGSWVAYGLGSENQNMPAFLVLPDPGGGIKGGPPAWGSGYLPAAYQGTTLRPGPSPLLHLQPPNGVSLDREKQALDLIRRMNERHIAERDFDTELAARINSYELAFRMQTSAPEFVDLGGETADTLSMYGVGESHTNEFGTRCLMARRLIERGVRFVQLYSGDTNGWDAHSDVLKNHNEMCGATDKPVAGLLTDLKQRGLLEDTLVIWGGEFGRMPMSEQGKGRDHNPWGYTTVLAGAGVKGGFAYGATDPVGLRAEENPVHVHDLHATILWILGIDHEQLTFFHNGRDERLTDVAGNVVMDVLA